MDELLSKHAISPTAVAVQPALSREVHDGMFEEVFGYPWGEAREHENVFILNGECPSTTRCVVTDQHYRNRVHPVLIGPSVPLQTAFCTNIGIFPNEFYNERYSDKYFAATGSQRFHSIRRRIANSIFPQSV